MNGIDLKAEVSRAVGEEWSKFAADHPRLAAELGRDLLIEQAVAALEEDPAYQDAMRAAATAGTLAETAGDIIRRCVQTLIGAVTSAGLS
jgi:thiazole synthase ThiGH ThiG subunit